MSRTVISELFNKWESVKSDYWYLLSSDPDGTASLQNYLKVAGFNQSDSYAMYTDYTMNDEFLNSAQTRKLNVPGEDPAYLLTLNGHKVIWVDGSGDDFYIAQGKDIPSLDKYVIDHPVNSAVARSRG